MFIYIGSSQLNREISCQVALELRSFYTYRNTACFTQDVREPVEAAFDAVKMAIGGYNSIDGTDLRDILDSLDAILSYKLVRCAHDKISPIVKKWSDASLPYVCVFHRMGVDGIRGGAAYRRVEAGPGNYRVRLDAIPQGDTLYYAEGDGFQLVVDPDKSSPREIASLIGKHIYSRQESFDTSQLDKSSDKE